MAEDDASATVGRPGISSVLVLASALSSPPAFATDPSYARYRVPVEAVVGTEDEEFLSFDAEPVSVTVLNDVETRIAAMDGWIHDLDELCQEAAHENWDGESAAPVQNGARRYAIALVAELAEGTRFPDVAIDPDGEISLGWELGDDVFSVSISGAGRFSYAGLFGTSDCHGTEWMVEQVPIEVTHQLDRLLLALRT
jgi:hypothetical protein